MTIYKLHNLLSDLIRKGHGRKPVCVDKSKVTNPLEADGAVILEIHNAEIMCIPMLDDDGWQKYNKDGSESSRRCLVLTGWF